VKMAMQVTGRKKVIFRDRSYHGATLAMLALPAIHVKTASTLASQWEYRGKIRTWRELDLGILSRSYTKKVLTRWQRCCWRAWWGPTASIRRRHRITVTFDRFVIDTASC
jgi:hypothetical protein